MSTTPPITCGCAPDVVNAVIEILENDPCVSALTANGGTQPYKIFYSELDFDVLDQFPEKSIVVRDAGGDGRFSQGTLQLIDPRISILCYGETPRIAKQLDTAVYQALRNVTPGTWANTYIHWCRPNSLGTALRDPDELWPYVVSSWSVLAYDQPMAA